MMPVIRISDEVFRRLQTIGVPLVDTPNSVIERLLDEFERPRSSPPMASSPAPREGQAATGAYQRPQGLFLAPASAENLATSVAKAVALQDVEARLDQESLETLRANLRGSATFRCWAMTTSSRGTFDNMQIGDSVLFTPKGTGRFRYRATVSAKFESTKLGDLLWQITPGKPWSLIYLLEDVKRIDVVKERLVAELGYDRSFPVYGITRVQPPRLAAAVTRHGSLDALLASVSARNGS